MNFIVIKALFLELLKCYCNWVRPTFGKAYLKWLNIFIENVGILFKNNMLENMYRKSQWIGLRKI